MAVLEVECPICGEVLELTDADRAELNIGDVIVCDSCHAEMEVTQNDERDFDLELLGILTECPNCGEEFDVTEDMIATTNIVQCPHCNVRIELDFENDE